MQTGANRREPERTGTGGGNVAGKRPGDGLAKKSARLQFCFYLSPRLVLNSVAIGIRRFSKRQLSPLPVS